MHSFVTKIIICAMIRVKEIYQTIFYLLHKQFFLFLRNLRHHQKFLSSHRFSRCVASVSDDDTLVVNGLFDLALISHVCLWPTEGSFTILTPLLTLIFRYSILKTHMYTIYSNCIQSSCHSNLLYLVILVIKLLINSVIYKLYP